MVPEAPVDRVEEAFPLVVGVDPLREALEVVEVEAVVLPRSQDPAYRILEQVQRLGWD